MDWLSLHDLLDLPQFSLAQTPSPLPSPSPTDTEVLKGQLEFLKQSYSQFVDTVKIIFTVLGVAGATIAYFFGKSFKDFQDAARQDVKDFQEFSRSEVKEAIQRIRQEAETQIPHLVQTEVSELIRAEVASVERALRREQVIGSTAIDYYLPDGTLEPDETELLRARKFNRVRFWGDVQGLGQFSRDVVVLDLYNWVLPLGQRFRELSKDDQQEPARQQIDALLAIPQWNSTVIIVYTRGQIFYLNTITDRYVIATNNPVSLVGNVADGAYVVVGDRTTVRNSRQK
jgi:hypothetical protein